MARILIIDDDPDLRAVLAQMLRLAGYEVALAANGREGLERALKQPADLVLTDIYMPEQEGLETILELRRRFPQLPVLAMSGRAAAGTMLGIAQRLGAIAVLQKPFSSDELLTLVSRSLAKQA